MADEERRAAPDSFSRGRFPVGLFGTGPAFKLIASGKGHDDPSVASPLALATTEQLPFAAYLAELDVQGVTVAPAVTLLVEANEYPGSAAGPVQAPITNDHAERVWVEAMRAWRAAAGGPGLTRINGLFLETIPDTGDLPRQRPIAWCRKTDRYVEPACPTCLGPLSTCRDERVLRRSGLPSFRGSLIRFLYCEVCVARAVPPFYFYTYDLRPLEGLANGVRVRRRGELHRDIAQQIKIGPAEPPVRHACFQCEHRHACYPAGAPEERPVPAESLLVPIAYYDFCFIPTETLPLSFDEIAGILGGATLSDLEPLRGGAPRSPGGALREEIDQRLSKRPLQYFYQGDGTGLFPLEVLFLKLCAFSRLLRGVCDLHERAGRAHLAISPDRVRGSLEPTLENQPVRWGATLELWDLVTSAPMEPDQAEGPLIWSIPHPTPGPYLPPALSRPQQETIWMRLRPRQLEITPAAGRYTARLTAELVSEHYRSADHGKFDIVRLQSGQLTAGGVEPLVVTGRRVETLRGGFLFAGQAASLSLEVAKTLEREGFPSSVNVEVTLIHAYHAPVDVFSLGLLLFRLLFLGDDFEKMPLRDRDEIGRVSAEIADSVRRGGGTPEVQARAALREILSREKISAGPSSVLYRRGDRTGSPVAIPAALWDDVLLLGFRTASLIPGWSVCGSLDDYRAEAPGEPIRRLIAEVDSLAVRARGALLGSIGRNRLVLQVLDDFLSDYRDVAADASADSGQSPRSEMTTMFKRQGAKRK